MNQPNIIVITADGLRWDSLGCSGNPDVRTPNIDALASHGLQFTQAFSACPHACSGAHTFLTGAVPTTFDPELPAASPGAEPLILPGRLRSAGYVTAAVGALDLPGERLEESFDFVEALGCPGQVDAYQAWLAAEGHATEDDEEVSGAPLLQEALHPTTWAGNEAVRLARSIAEPFFLWVSLPRPRWPLDPPVPWKHMYRPSRLQLPAGSLFMPLDPDLDIADSRDRAGRSEAEFRRVLTAWYGSISHVDRQIGRLLATLTARGRTNNMFAVTSGRGEYLGYRGLLNTMPGPLYEPLTHVPLIIGGVPNQRRGRMDSALVSTGDLVPTLLEVLQLETVTPGGSRSLNAHLREEGLPHRRAVVLLADDGGGLRSARYKWLVEGNGQRERLFDLQADPLERHNLHGERQSPAIRKMLLASLGSGAVEPQR